MKIMIIGGAGFIGSHFVDYALSMPETEAVFVIDSLTYAGSEKNLEISRRNKKFKFLKEDINNLMEYRKILQNYDCVLNFAAESHVDRSILNPDVFFKTNALGVATAVRFAMESSASKFIQISTDEVYGPLINGVATETSILNPTSPYAASKAGGELFAMSFWRTYRYPVVITRGCNTYGSRQFPEKLIPLALERLKTGKKVPIYGSGNQIREWISVRDHVSAIWQLCISNYEGEFFNIGTEQRFTNLQIIKTLIEAVGENSEEKIEFVSDRKGHDERYAINSNKIRMKLNWEPKDNIMNDLSDISSW